MKTTVATVDASPAIPESEGSKRTLCASDDISALGCEVCNETQHQHPIRVMVVRSVAGAGGGAEKIILRTAEHADPQQLQMTICAIHHDGDSTFDLPNRARSIGVEVIPVVQHRLFDSSVLNSLWSIAKSGKFDIIHSHDYKANFYALKLRRHSKLPVVSTAHGWTGDLLREKYFYYPIDKFMLKRFNAVIGVSTEICNELHRRGIHPDRIRAILNGVDPAQYRRDESTRAAIRRELDIRDGDIVIGSVGRVEKQKRFDLLVEAFARLAKQRESLQLIIVGEGTLLASLRELIDQHGLRNRCRLLGQRPDMKRVYNAFDLYVQSSEYEGTPTVLVEAMAMELPIVATDVGGTTELVFPNQHALVVPSQDVPALSDAICASLEDRMATQQRVAHARRRVECELSIEVRTARLIELYSAVIAHSSGRLYGHSRGITR